MNAKPFFVVLVFILFLATLASGAMSTTDLTTGDGDFRGSGGSSSTTGGMDYNVFGGTSSGGSSVVGGVSTNAGGVSGGPCGDVYTVRSGDTLSRIAQNCGLPLSVLLSINPTVTNPNLISVGQKINIYVAPAPQKTTTPTSAPKPTAPPDDGKHPGGSLPIEVKGFPPFTEVTVGIGKEGAQPTTVDDGITDEQGRLKITVKIPAKAKAGEKWLVTITSTGKNPITVRSDVVTLHK